MTARWLVRLVVAAMVMATAATVVALVVYVQLSDNDSQFCSVAAQRLLDKEDQIVQSESYLKTPAGQETTGLNAFIRTTSLPRLRAEVKSDRRTLPGSCRDEYDALKRD